MYSLESGGGKWTQHTPFASQPILPSVLHVKKAHDMEGMEKAAFNLTDVFMTE